MSLFSALSWTFGRESFAQSEIKHIYETKRGYRGGTDAYADARLRQEQLQRVLPNDQVQHGGKQANMERQHHGQTAAGAQHEQTPGF